MHTFSTELGGDVYKRQAEGSLTASQTRRAGTKVGLSDPVASKWKGHRSTDKSYPGDNRLISVSYTHLDVYKRQ